MAFDCDPIAPDLLLSHLLTHSLMFLLTYQDQTECVLSIDRATQMLNVLGSKENVGRVQVRHLTHLRCRDHDQKSPRSWSERRMSATCRCATCQVVLTHSDAVVMSQALLGAAFLIRHLPNMAGALLLLDPTFCLVELLLLGR